METLALTWPQEMLQGDFATNLQFALQKYGYRRIFVVSGKTAFALSGAQNVLAAVARNLDIQYFVYSDFSTNPKYQDLRAGATALRAFVPDCILAVGGGSAMDTAKLLANPKLNLADFTANLGLASQDLANFAHLPLWVAPSTAGSGAEATRFAVLYYQRQKYSINCVLPCLVFLDSVLCRTTPTQFAKAAGLDALCQGIESYWAAGATSQSQTYALQAIQLVTHSLKAALFRNQAQSWRNLQYGAFLAGKAINLSKTTAAHAFSYHLTTEYNVIHGHAVALMLCYIMEYTVKFGNEQAQAKCKAIAVTLQPNGDLQANNLGIYLRDLLAEFSLANSLAAVGVDSAAKIELLCNSVNIGRLQNHPMQIDLTALQQMLA